MRAYELYLKGQYSEQEMLELLSSVLDLSVREIMIVPEFTGEEDIENKSLLCILSNVGGEFKTNIVLYPYKEELCEFSSYELGEKIVASTLASCLIFKGTENPYLYSVIEVDGQRDVLVDDEILEGSDQIRVLKSVQ